MGILDRNTECCGANFENNNISKLGLFLISCPYIIIFWIFSPLILLFSFKKKNKNLLVVIYRAKIELIRKAILYPKLKCSISGKFYGVSTWFSGWIFKYFNLCLLLLWWAFLIALFWGVWFIWP